MWHLSVLSSFPFLLSVVFFAGQKRHGTHLLSSHANGDPHASEPAPSLPPRAGLAAAPL